MNKKRFGRKQQRGHARRKLCAGFPYYQQIWWDAIEELRKQLTEECSLAKPDQMRFQNGRLIKNLSKRIEAAGKDRLGTTKLCYSLMTEPSLQLGYDEPRRLHLEEWDAIAEMPEDRTSGPTNGRRKLSHWEWLLVQLDSIASWIEAQESLGMWLEFRHNRAFWQRNDPDRQTAAFQVQTLAELPDNTIEYEVKKGRKIRGAPVWAGRGLGVDSKGVPWTPRQWANILEQAVRRAVKGPGTCTELEQWIWWCYPVFIRYGWNWREVRDVARERGFEESNEITEMELRRYWMTRGLRLAGTKTNRPAPLLAEFVRRVLLPDPRNVRGVVIWG